MPSITDSAEWRKYWNFAYIAANQLGPIGLSPDASTVFADSAIAVLDAAVIGLNASMVSTKETRDYFMNSLVISSQVSDKRIDLATAEVFAFSALQILADSGGVDNSDTLRNLYVDPVLGDDANSGLDASNAFLTIQRAVDLFKGSSNTHWLFGDDRTINVIGADGVVMTESIVIPSHAGMGALIIKGQETTVESDLVIAGTPFNSIASYEVRQTLNLTGAGLTPSTYQYDAFVIPQASLADGVFDATFDCLPIIDNAASSLTVVSLDPGTYSAFSYPSGSLCDIVKPNITWKPENSSAFSYINIPGIVCMGGPLIIEGFRLEPAEVGGNYGSFIQTVATGAENSLGSSVVMTRNITKGGFAKNVQGEGVAFNGNIIDDPGAFITFSNVRDLTINNLAARTGILVIERGAACIYGIDLLQTAATVGGLRIRALDFGLVFADIRASAGTTQFVATISKDFNIAALSVEDAGANAAISLFSGNCSLKLATNATRLNGTANNTGVGMDVTEGAWAEGSNETSITLSGSSGDMKVGALPSRDWATGSQTDPEELARYST